MATQVQLRRGTAAENDAFTGAQGEVTVDTTNDTLRVHDGSLAGGYEVITADASGNIDVTGTVTFDGGTTSANLNFGDNDKAVFGAGGDLEIYHDNSNSFIKDLGTGTLRIQGSTSVAIQSTGAEDMALFVNNSDVRLFYDGAQKFATTSTGIDVTGTVTFDGGTTSADLNFGDNDKAVFGAGSDLQIYHDGSNSYVSDQGTGSLLLNGSATVQIGDTSGNNNIVATANGSTQIRYANSTKLTTTSTGIDVTGEIKTNDDITIETPTNSQIDLKYSKSGGGFSTSQDFGAISFQTTDGDWSTTGYVEAAAIALNVGDSFGRNANLVFRTGFNSSDPSSESMRIDGSSNRNLHFNSGYGSVARAFGCRAWVNFNGTGTVAIRESGNVSSITDNGTGNYTVNFTTAMPDDDYSVTAAAGGGITGTFVTNITLGTSGVSVLTVRSDTRGVTDATNVCLSIFR